jgi:hypothetical protein
MAKIREIGYKDQNRENFGELPWDFQAENKNLFYQIQVHVLK